MKKRKIILLIVIIAFLILGTILIISAVRIQQMKISQGQVIGPADNEEISKRQHSMNYKNIEILNELTGTMPVSTTTQKVESCIYINLPYIFEEVKNYSEEELSDYYNKNKAMIREGLNISTETNFINLIRRARALNCDLIDDYESCAFGNVPGEGLTFIVKYKNGNALIGKIVGLNAVTILFEF